MLSKQERNYLTGFEEYSPAYARQIRTRIRKKVNETLKDILLIINKDGVEFFDCRYHPAKKTLMPIKETLEFIFEFITERNKREERFFPDFALYEYSGKTAYRIVEEFFEAFSKLPKRKRSFSNVLNYIIKEKRRIKNE